MIRIGIELNGIVRDINSQIVKYYAKDINKSYDVDTADKNVLNIAEYLDFGSKKKREEFLYVDYPYEVFGCARVNERNLATKINNWLIELENDENEDYEVLFFSTNENALTIQSTYYFLSKIGCRVREMHFPKNSEKMWDICDVIVTTNKNIVNNKPNGKKVVLIEKNDNKELVEKSDLHYNKLTEVLDNKNFMKNNSESITEPIKSKGFFEKIKVLLKR